MSLSDILAEILVLESTFLRVEKLKNSQQTNDIKMKENIKNFNSMKVTLKLFKVLK